MASCARSKCGFPLTAKERLSPKKPSWLLSGDDGPQEAPKQREENTPMPPSLANGKICYIEMPATDVRRSAEFYEKVFGWNIRKRGDGSIAFDDTVGQVSGTWVRGRPPSDAPGLLVYIMVDSVAATMEAVA